MSKVLQHKVVAALPTPLEPDSIYYVRKGDGFDIHVTNGVGVVTAYSLNADVKLDGKVDSNDPRLTDSREWSEETVAQEEAEAGTASTRRAWTAQRVRQAINAWWQLVTSGFGRNFITASNEQAARNVLQLTYPATAPTVGDGVEVMRAGAYGIGLGQEKTPNTAMSGQFGFWNPYTEVENVPFVYGTYVTSTGPAGSGAFQLAVESKAPAYLDNFQAAIRTCTTDGVRLQELGAWQMLYHSGNTLNIGTTAATARTALNLFADSSGIITNGSGALTNDVSEFLSLNTYADMSAKIQGVHSYVELSNNSTSSTPMAGYYYLLPRNNEYALTHTFTCTYSATTVKTWRMLVYRSWSTSVFVSPNFAVTGLSGSVKIYGTFQNAMTNVLIEFTQIGQSVTGQIVSQWN